VNNAYLERARKIIPDPKVLSIIAAKRARQLAMGARPMVKCNDENHIDIALYEIAENKIGIGKKSDDFLSPETTGKE
jgi:DNA-directed RNA polymerase omega subunit